VAARGTRAASGDAGDPRPKNQTPWQELYRKTVGQHATGALDFATQYTDIIAQHGNPRHSH
jgi:dihydroxy-acid dehydratase